MQSLLAEITRGERVESVHNGSIAVVDADGKLVSSVGDPDMFLYFRSSAKPFQAIPVIESGAADHFGFTPAELALCCASHHAELGHQQQVLALLAKLGLDDTALQCGCPLPSDEEEMAKVLTGERARTPLQCDCSGKHTGMIAACLQLGYPIDSYLEPSHPLQQTIRALIAAVCDVDPASLEMATDGCSLPTFGSTLRAFARSYATLARPAIHGDALNRLRAAMIAVPENVSGRDTLVTDLMRVGRGKIVAKSGAEGLLCMGLPDQGLGIAIRVEDGSFRSHPTIVIACLRQLNAIPENQLEELTRLHDPIIYNHNRRVVGERRAAYQLNQPISTA